MKARYWIAGCVGLAVWLPLAAAAEEAFTVRDTNVFAGPSSEYPPIGELPVNAGVDVFGCLSDWTWCDVGFGPNRGWIYAGDIVVPYDNQRVAIVEYGSRIHLPVLMFSLTAYWDEHYRSRPWYGERQQWITRVHIDANRGGPAPAGHERAASVAPATPQAAPTRAAPAPATKQADRNAKPAETRQAQAARTSKEAQQQAQQQTKQTRVAQSPKPEQSQQQTKRAQVAQSPKPEQSQQQAKAQPPERQASTRMAQGGERQAQQPQKPQQAAKPEAAPKVQTKEEKPQEEH